MINRRFIEEHFPIKDVSAEASREKSISHGHISSMHRWWARRPLAASRATLYAALTGAPTNAIEVNDRKKEIALLAEWENSLNQDIVRNAQKRILEYNKSVPRILDPFGGGGSIPLEALRLGCEAWACDYNPIANLIVKATIEYPFLGSDKSTGMQQTEKAALIDEVKKWSQWVMEEAKKELIGLFANEGNEETVGYLWSRCIPCQNPACGVTIPLLKQFWLANTTKRKIALIPIRGSKITFRIVRTDSKGVEGFDPTKGSVADGKATCLNCNYRMTRNQVKTLFVAKKNSEKLNVVITKNTGRTGKTYKISTENDIELFEQAQKMLKVKLKHFHEKYGFSPIPTESLPETGTLGFRVQLYGLQRWSELFNDRQKLVLVTFTEKILEASEKIMTNNSKSGRSILTYLAMMFDLLVEKNSTLCRYVTKLEAMPGTFGRQALPMVWDYAEINPFTNVGWPNIEQRVLRALDHLTSIKTTGTGTMKHASSTSLPFDNEFFDAVATDPPYYDNVPYSHLSDYFYVWTKGILGSQFPELFTTPLTPKSDEIVAYSHGSGGKRDGKIFFERMLAKSFREINRVLKPDGIVVIVYAHKSTDGWETLINSLLQAGLVVTAAWPVHTEKKGRLRSNKSAALLSSIYMVCRKIKREPLGFYPDVKKDLKKYLDKKLDQLWLEGVSGADFFISSIGSAIEVYGRYDKVLDSKDNIVSVSRLLDDTRTMVTDYAMNKVIRGEFSAELSKMTRFYILWRWSHGEAKVPFDEAHKLAQSVGINLAEEWVSGFIHKDKEYIRVIGPDEREPEGLDESRELIDILHHALRLWKGPKSSRAAQFLASKGYKDSEVLRRVAQAISESLPDANSSKEKDWIEGMFTGRLGVKSDHDQAKLF